MLEALMVNAEDVILEEELHVQWKENLVVAVAAFVFFWANFALSWYLSNKRVPEFAAFPPEQRADWCSRVNSTIHAVTVVAGVTYALTAITWGDDFLPISSLRSASFIFSIAIGYFICDLMVILIWPVPMRWVFVIHHIVAVIPYFINNFVSCCAACQFGLLLFLLVELATLPLNVRGFIDAVGKADSKNYTRAIYVTYIIWAISRTLLPIFLVYVFWAFAYPSTRNHDTCLYPNLVGAHVIAMFCVGVFFFVHTPEIIARWRSDTSPEATPKAMNAVIAVSSTRNISNKEADVTDDSYDDAELGVLPRSAPAS